MVEQGSSAAPPARVTTTVMPLPTVAAPPGCIGISVTAAFRFVKRFVLLPVAIDALGLRGHSLEGVLD